MYDRLPQTLLEEQVMAKFKRNIINVNAYPTRIEIDFKLNCKMCYLFDIKRFLEKRLGIDLKMHLVSFYSNTKFQIVFIKISEE